MMQLINSLTVQQLDLLYQLFELRHRKSDEKADEFMQSLLTRMGPATQFIIQPLFAFITELKNQDYFNSLRNPPIPSIFTAGSEPPIYKALFYSVNSSVDVVVPQYAKISKAAIIASFTKAPFNSIIIDGKRELTPVNFGENGFYYFIGNYINVPQSFNVTFR